MSFIPSHLPGGEKWPTELTIPLITFFRIVARDEPGGNRNLIININAQHNVRIIIAITKRVFRPTLRLSHLFTFKDKIPKGLRYCVVYHFKCRCCSASYVGQTVRHLHTRVSEHLGISALTGNKSSNPKLTSILQHLDATGHTASLDDFKIISSCSSSDELMIHESLLISKLKPTLNVQGSSVPLLLL